jgi:hypothetical protein
MGGSALAPASLEKSDAPSPSPAEGGSGCQMRGGRKSRKARKSRKSRK